MKWGSLVETVDTPHTSHSTVKYIGIVRVWSESFTSLISRIENLKFRFIFWWPSGLSDKHRNTIRREGFGDQGKVCFNQRISTDHRHRATHTHFEIDKCSWKAIDVLWRSYTGRAAWLSRNCWVYTRPGPGPSPSAAATVIITVMKCESHRGVAVQKVLGGSEPAEQYQQNPHRAAALPSSAQ